MRIAAYSEFLEKAWRKRRRVMSVGKPGVGKTVAEREAAARMGWDYIGTSVPLLSPVKIGGYPKSNPDPGGDATHQLFDGIARAFRAQSPTILSLGDLGMGNGETLKAALDLVQFGTIDCRKIPDCVTIVASTNDVGHGADVQGLIEPLKTRWETIIEVETHIDDVVQYGLSRGWAPDMLAYLRNAPGALHDWKPSKSMKVDGACPRGWEYCAGWIADGIDDPEVIAGCVGKGRATQYLAFRQLIAELPDIDGVIRDPEGAPVPENPSARFLVSTALSSKMTASNFGACVRYLNRLPAMFRAFSIRDSFRAESIRRRDGKLPKDWKPLSSSQDFTAWACSADGKEVMAAAA